MSGTNLETIVNFSKRKGFVFQSSEIYGGFAATYDYGPLGFLLKQNLVKAWRDWNVNTRTDTTEIEGAIFLHPKVWQASGHIAGFADLMVEDLKTHKRYRADHLVEDAGVVWPVATNNGELLTENTILFATTNIGKINRVKRLLRDRNLNILTLSDLDYTIVEPEETGNNVVENAEIKAKYYWDNLKTKIPVICEDQGTYFIGVDENDNPRKDIKKPVIQKYGNSDQENMISYYSDLATKYGGILEEVWEYGFSFYNGVDIFKTKAVADNVRLMATPNYPGVLGFPFSSLCQHKIGDNWKYASDVSESEMEQHYDQPIKEKLVELLNLAKTTPSANPATLKTKTHPEPSAHPSSEGTLITNAGSFTAEELDQIIEFYNLKSPDGNPVSKAKSFNLLVKTHLGPVEDETTVAYLKGESCQNIYVDWKLVQETTRRKLPFGIAQLGKAFRNEVTVKQFMFRTREFEQIDLQYFVKPGEEDKWYDYWKQNHYQFYTEKLGFKPENLQWYQHSKEELAFYAKDAWDIYYKYGALGYKEMQGFHNRTDYDTKVHQEHSGQDLTYLDPFTNERYLPYIVEMSAGLNRMFLALLFEFYNEEEIGGDKTHPVQQAGHPSSEGIGEVAATEGANETRIVLKFPYHLAPYKLAILPLMKKDGLAELATDLYAKLRSSGLSVDYDESGSIGKRYRRQDENGTPFCVTIDYDTRDKGLVTIRNRDTMAQETIKIEEIEEYLNSNKS